MNKAELRKGLQRLKEYLASQEFESMLLEEDELFAENPESFTEFNVLQLLHALN